MKRAYFYVLHNTLGGIKAVEVDGFSIRVDGEDFYVYESESKMAAYIIDPKTGTSIYGTYRVEKTEKEEHEEGYEEELWEYDLVKRAVEEFRALPDILKKFREMKEIYKEKYAEHVKRFQSCVKEYEQEEETREAEKKENAK